MRVRLKVKTPKGHAKSVNKKLKPIVLGLRNKHKTYVSPDEDEIIWDIQGDLRYINKVIRNVSLYDQMVSLIMQNKKVKKRLEPGDREALEEMLKDQTSIEVVEKATDQEREDQETSWWKKVKSKFTELPNK